MQGTTRGCDEAPDPSQVEEVANRTNSCSALELESDHGSEDDPAEDQFASGRAKEGSHRVVLTRTVMACPVVEGSLRDAELFGVVPLGRVAGFAEVVQGSGDVRTRPTGRLLARPLCSSRLILRHGSLSLHGLLAEPL